MEQIENALMNFKQALEIRQNTALKSNEDNYVNETLQEISRCHAKMQHKELALVYLIRATKSKLNASSVDADMDKKLATTFYENGCSFLYLHKKFLAMRFFKQSLEIQESIKREIEIKETTLLDAETKINVADEKIAADKSIAETLYQIGCCYNLQKNSLALENLKGST